RYVARSGGSGFPRRRWWATGVEAGPNPRGFSNATWEARSSPARESEPRGEPTGLRGEEEGASECRPVMGRIGLATLPHPKGGRLPAGVGGRERSANRRRGRRRSVGAVVMTVAGAAPATEVMSVAGTGVVTLRWTPRPMGPPRAYPKARRPM